MNDFYIISPNELAREAASQQAFYQRLCVEPDCKYYKKNASRSCAEKEHPFIIPKGTTKRMYNMIKKHINTGELGA